MITCLIFNVPTRTFLGHVQMRHASASSITGAMVCAAWWLGTSTQCIHVTNAGNMYCPVLYSIELAPLYCVAISRISVL